jgi:two-component system OmpR family response regulator
MNILVVDDEWSVAASVKAVLKGMGHVVDVLHHGGDALARLIEWPDHYHVLITDHDMRRISGIELLEQLEGKLFGGKIVVMSGSMTDELAAQYRTLGAHKILTKPFHMSELHQAVEEVQPQEQCTAGFHPMDKSSATV